MLRVGLIVGMLLLLGACSSSGIVAGNVNLSLVDVSVTQSGNVDEGAKFSHQLREEIRVEFSRALNDNKTLMDAQLFLDVQKLDYRGMVANVDHAGITMVAARGRLIDSQSGNAIGDFPLNVKYKDEQIVGINASAQAIDHSYLIRLMARAALEKVYGNLRVSEITSNFALHERETYEDDTVNPILVSALRPVTRSRSTFSGVYGPPMRGTIGDELPKVIKAPQMPIQ